jgi:hypothetical protein
MKTSSANRSAILAALLAFTSHTFAQGGSLTPPPGAPAPVMRTLDEIYTQGENIDTRAESIGLLTVQQGLQLTSMEGQLKQVRQSTPLSIVPGDATALRIITAPGHYHLDADITGESGKVGIRINAQNVTLDLNGRTLTGVSGTTKGIEVNLPGPVIIRNGTLRAWPQQAVHIVTADYILQDLVITNTLDKGVESNGVGIIERVTVKSAKNFGLYCNNANPSTIRDCRVEGISSTTSAAIGIFAPKSLISRCAVSNVTGSSTTSTESGAVCGISATDGMVQSCIVRGIVQSGGASSYCFGIYGAAQTLDSSVQQVSSSAVATVAGIKGVQIDRSTVSSVNSLLYAYGILDAQCVSNSTVTNAQTGISGHQVIHNRVKDVQTGVLLLSAGTARENIIEATYVGIWSDFGKAVIGNTVLGPGTEGPTGIFNSMTNPVIRIEDNHVTGWAKGIWSSAGLVRRNSVGECAVPYDISASMVVVPITAPGTNPNANVSF